MSVTHVAQITPRSHCSDVKMMPFVVKYRVKCLMLWSPVSRSSLYNIIDVREYFIMTSVLRVIECSWAHFKAKR